MSETKDAATPLYLQAAQLIADDLGVEVRALLDEYDRAVLESDYPGEECLEPEEVEEYVTTGSLFEERLTHARECTPCAALLCSAAPQQDQRERFIQELLNESVRVGESAIGSDLPAYREIAAVAAAQESSSSALRAAWDKKVAAFLADTSSERPALAVRLRKLGSKAGVVSPKKAGSR